MTSFDRVADVYDATRSLRPDIMAKAVGVLLSRLGGCTVIDFGVGTGRFAAPLAVAGLEVVGVDISDRMIRQALKKGAGDLVLSDASRVPFRDQSFDYALAVHFLHLARDWRETVGEMARVTREGLLTLIEDLGEVGPTQIYVQIAERMGHKFRGTRVGERDLVKRATPRLIEDVARYEENFDPAKLLTEYASKLQSVTWEVPDELNGRIVGEMAKRMGEKRTVRRSLSLVVWTREQLLGLHPLA